jgi:hypothetical protein
MANTQINLMQRYISAILKAPEPLRQNPEVFNEVMSLVDDAKGKLNAAMSRGEDISNVRLFEDDQAEAIAQVVTQMERNMPASSAPLGRPDFGTGAPPDMSMPQAIPTQREPSMTQSDMDRAMANNKLADEMAPNYALPSSPRPKPRPANLGTMGQTRPQLRP